MNRKIQRRNLGTSYGVRLPLPLEEKVSTYLDEEQLSFAEFARYAIKREIESVFPEKEYDFTRGVAK